MADNFDYRLRPGKSIVRKVIFEWLSDLMPPRGDAKRYRDDVQYIGFGATFFVDFVHAFKQLRIRNMVSLEADTDRYQRAIYNKPYSSVKIHNQESTDYLISLSADPSQYVAWLDYTDSLQEYILQDASIAAAKFGPGSFYVITLNASPNFPGTDGGRDNTATNRARMEAFRDMIGDGFPEDIEPASMSRRLYPAVASRVLIGRLCSEVRIASGGQRSFVPSLVFKHQDGAPMLTIAGAIANARDTGPHRAMDVEETSRCFRQRLRLLRPPEINEVQTPVLTPKEIRALETRIPDSRFAKRRNPSELDPETVRRGTTGVAISGREWESYLRYHPYYPVYSELSPWF